jgi:hypothetical protein
MYIFIFLILLVVVFIYLFRNKKEKFDISEQDFEQLKNIISQQFTNPENNTIAQIIINLETSKQEALQNRLKKFKELNNQYFNDQINETLYFDLRMNRDETIRKQLVKGMFIYKSIITNNQTTPEYNKLLLNMITDYAKNNNFTKSKYEYLI